MLRIDEIIETFIYVAGIMRSKYYHSNFINRNDIYDALADLLLDFLEGNSKEMPSNNESISKKELQNKALWYCDRDILNLIEHRQKNVSLDANIEEIEYQEDSEGKNTKKSTIVPDDLITRTDIDIERKIDAQIIRENISEENKELFRLRFDENMSWKEVAAELKLVGKNNNIADYIIIGRYDNNGNLKENKVLYIKPYGRINFVEPFSIQNNEVYFIGILNNEKIISFSVKI